METQKSASVLAAMQFVSGGSAGFVEVCLMQPLDVIKTRFQIQGGPNDVTRYTSMSDCVRRMYTTEGPLSFYKGILPPIMADVPKRAIKFFMFERFKTLLSPDSATPTPLAITAAGLLSGLIEGLAINPFEVVKVTLQSDRHQFKDQKSTFATAREIVGANGFGRRGLNKGLTATLARHGLFNMVYFGMYHNLKNMLPPPKDRSHDFLRRFAIGLLAGVLGSVINIPFDVAKSRIQGPQPVAGHIKYRSCVQTILLVYREEGYLALYKGLLPKVLRLGPGGAIMMIMYEITFEKLQQMY